MTFIEQAPLRRSGSTKQFDAFGNLTSSDGRRGTPGERVAGWNSKRRGSSLLTGTTGDRLDLDSVGKSTRERIEQEISEGKLGIARDRLYGLLRTFPHDVEIRSRLGDVYSKLGYPAEAGRFWFLDSDLTEEKLAAVDEFRRRCQANPALMLRRLRIECTPESLSTFHARLRVRELMHECGKAGTDPSSLSPAHKTQVLSRLSEYFCLGIAILFVVLAVIGLMTVAKWIRGS